MNKEFWSDVLRSGAILGLVMSISHIFEHYMLAFSDADLLQTALVYCVEWLLACVVFIVLLVYFTNRRAKAKPSELGATYSYLLSFIILISMLSGVLVGVADTLFISAMGYDNYILGFVDRIDQLGQVYTEMGVHTENMSLFEDLTTELRQMGQPSIFVTVFNQLQIYAFTGCIPGFIIAGIISSRHRRKAMQK